MRKTLRWINVIFLLCLTFLTIVDVVARYIFHTSFFDAMTFSSYLLCMINIIALSDITYLKRHVEVEIIYNKFSKKYKRIIDIFNYSVGAILFLIMSISALEKAIYSFNKGIYKGWMALPEFPVKFVFAAGCFLTGITFLILLKEKIKDK